MDNNNLLSPVCIERVTVTRTPVDGICIICWGVVAGFRLADLWGNIGLQRLTTLERNGKLNSDSFDLHVMCERDLNLSSFSMKSNALDEW